MGFRLGRVTNIDYHVVRGGRLYHRDLWDATGFPRHDFGNQLVVCVFDRLIQNGEIEAAFLSANPGLEPDQITVTCKSNRIQEVRICLTKDLHWRDCAPDTRRDCTVSGAGFQPIR